MSEHPRSFQEWQTLAKEAPERLADLFLGKLELLAPESQKALIAAKLSRRSLIQKIKAGCADPDQPLAGVPYMVQDMFDLNGLPTACGAPFADPFEAPLDESSLLVQAMSRRGGTCLAKTVPSEFGWDMQGRNTTYGSCPHSAGLRYVCGGGAGSSANVVADGWVPLAFGLDSCGGIRIPTAFHGLFGFRMETNAFAREGVFPIVPSLESVGWITANAEDMKKTFLSFYRPKPEPLDNAPRGLLLNYGMDLSSTETKAGLMDLVRRLDIDDEPSVNKLLSMAMEPVSRAFQTIETRELYSVHQYWIEEYRAYYDSGLLRQIDAGKALNPTESDKATHVQPNLRATLVSLLRDYDYLVMPVSPLPSPEKTEWDTVLESEILQLNAPVSLSFLPSLVLPFKCGEGKSNAAQVIFNPRKLQIVPELLDQLSDYYARY